jgi:hypothetical protein
VSPGRRAGEPRLDAEPPGDASEGELEPTDAEDEGAREIAAKLGDPVEPPRARGDERPGFLEKFPRDPALDALVAAFVTGDYARVRREAPALARQTDDDAIARAARELRRRLDPDPLARWLFLGAASLLAFLALWFWSHAHGAP